MLDSISQNIKLQYFTLFIVAVLAYSNTLNHSYTWDDALVIQQNEYTRAGFSGLKDIWTKKVFLHNRNVYRPIPQTIYALTYQIAPNNPTAAHLVNILFYALAIVATFWFLGLLFSQQNKWLLFFISLMFTLHPTHTEVVANIKSLDEILAYLFGIISLSFWLVFLKKQIHYTLILSISFFAFGLLSKISAITFLVVFPLTIWFYIGNFTELSKNIIQYSKNFFVEKITSNKSILTLSVFLFILIGLLFVKQFNILLILVLTLFSFLLLKTETKIILTVLFSLLIIVLSGFNYQTSLVLSTILISHYLLINKILPKAYIGFCLGVFIVAFSFINENIRAIILAIFFSSLPFLLPLKKDKTLISILCIMSIILLITKLSLSSFTLVLILIVSYLLFYKRFDFKLIYIVLFTTALFFDTFYFNKYSSFQKLNISSQIFQIENNNDISIGMTILHNTLVAEDNKMIKLATIAKIQLKYLQLLVFPHPLVHQYGFNQLSKTNFKDWKVWFSIIIHLGLFLFALSKLKNKSPIAFGILYYIATISIYTNMIVLMPDTLAERFLFSPSLGFCIAIVFATNAIFNTLKIKSVNFAIFILFIPILLAFSYKTIDRNKAWENNFSLAKNTIKQAPNNAAIHAQYATELFLKNGDSSLILKYYKRAIEIYPEFYSATKDLAHYYIKLKQPKKAEKQLLKCIKFNTADWESFYYLAFINYDNKNYTQAISFFQNALVGGSKKVGKEKYIYSSEFLARCYFNTKQITLADNLLKDNYVNYQAKSSIVLLGNIYHEADNIRKSIETYSLLLNDFPEDRDLLATIKILKEALPN